MTMMPMTMATWLTASCWCFGRCSASCSRYRLRCRIFDIFINAVADSPADQSSLVFDWTRLVNGVDAEARCRYVTECHAMFYCCQWVAENLKPRCFLQRPMPRWFQPRSNASHSNDLLPISMNRFVRLWVNPLVTLCRHLRHRHREESAWMPINRLLTE